MFMLLPNLTASAPSCPWQGLAAYGPPNVKWCEERLCAWVNEPANAWSNLAYIFVGLFIYFFTDVRARRGASLEWFPPTIIAVGVCSGLYHASNTYITQMLDFFGMYLFCFLLILLNSVRLGWLRREHFAIAFIGKVLGLTVLTAVIARYGFPIQGIVSLLTLCIVVTELLCRRRSAAPYSLRNFGISLGLLIAGAGFSASDVSRKWCDPGNHLLQGHAVWHVLSALSLLFAFYHYRQFSLATSERDGR
jgi:hypothetical protein